MDLMVTEAGLDETTHQDSYSCDHKAEMDPLHLSHRLREPVSPTLASTIKLPGTLANSREGPCERLAGTAKIIFGLEFGLDDVENEGEGRRET